MISRYARRNFINLFLLFIFGGLVIFFVNMYWSNKKLDKSVPETKDDRIKSNWHAYMRKDHLSIDIGEIVAADETQEHEEESKLHKAKEEKVIEEKANDERPNKKAKEGESADDNKVKDRNRTEKDSTHINTSEKSVVMVKQHTEKEWTDQHTICDIPHDKYPTTTLKTSVGKIELSTYNPNEAYFSSVMKHSTYEGDLLQKVIVILKNRTDHTFVDVGALNGEYGFTAAMMGHHVVIVDPVLGNIQRMCETVRREKYNDKIVIAYNAAGEKTEPISLAFKKGNVGETQVRKDDGLHRGINTTYSITLDKLMPFLKSKQVVMKVDVEGFEDEVVGGADEFFNRVDVSYCVMEWVHHRKDKIGANKIYEFMTKHKMVPLAGHRNTLEKLDFKDYTSWDLNVIWKKEV